MNVCVDIFIFVCINATVYEYIFHGCHTSENKPLDRRSRSHSALVYRC